MRTLALSLLTWLVLASPTLAIDYFVNNVAGDDLADGRVSDTRLGAGGPVRTIDRALCLANKGDRIILAATGVPYRESISLSSGYQSGYSFRPFTIIGNGAILSGTKEVPYQAWEHVHDHVFRFRPHYLTYQQLYLDDKPATRRKIVPGENQLPALEPLQWMLHEGYILFRTEKDKLPRDYALSYAAGQVGITLDHVQHVHIHDLIIQGFHLDGINAHDSAMECVFRHVTCRGNGRSGMSIGGASRVEIDDCLVGDNGAVQIRTEGYCTARVEKSVVVDNTAPAFNVTGGKLQVDGKLIPRDR